MSSAISEIRFMQAVRERLTEELSKHKIHVGSLDLVWKKDCKPLLMPDHETYAIKGMAIRDDKTKSVAFSQEFIAKIGFDNEGVADVQEMSDAIAQDVIMYLAGGGVVIEGAS